MVVEFARSKLSNPNPIFVPYLEQSCTGAGHRIGRAGARAAFADGHCPGLSLRSGEQSDADFAQKHNQTILQRGSTPEDLAHALLYILSAPSMTGTTLMVDGGQHLTASARDVMFLP